ncbi:hypothetical protein K7H99_20580 (plasmid) [Providencia rettgeri]|nr:hypothetical protein K7H99_20580 [Providencia rettgeri]
MRYLTGSAIPHVACERLPPVYGERELLFCGAFSVGWMGMLALYLLLLS